MTIPGVQALYEIPPTTTEQWQDFTANDSIIQPF